jgi:hypothetical protein
MDEAYNGYTRKSERTFNHLKRRWLRLRLIGITLKPHYSEADQI